MRRTPLHLWHLLSLDAPTVATLWIWFIARACNVTLPWQAPVAMFLAVWVLYAADRLLDARTGPPAALEERHRFHYRHRRAFVLCIAVAAVSLAALTPELFPAALRLYALLGALLAGWFLLIHMRVAEERRLPKEAVVGVFFAAAIFIPTVSHRPELRPYLIFPAVLFATLCALNCMFLYSWEHPDAAIATSAHATTRFLTRRLVPATIMLFATCTVFLFFTRRREIPIAIGLSAALLLALHLRREHINRLSLRAYADLALLTPLLLIWRQR